MPLVMNLARRAHPRDHPPHDRRAATSSSTGHLVRELAGLTVIKMLVLALIYILFFSGAKHRLPLDAAAHIADPPPSYDSR
ncbi:MAG TPA: hypothetical protein VGP48_03835 [Stellaceae bacterium]|jgi:hypothetical protein|nr:hypothetical protein [Stellaceae bacterium]